VPTRGTNRNGRNELASIRSRAPRATGLRANWRVSVPWRMPPPPPFRARRPRRGRPRSPLACVVFCPFRSPHQPVRARPARPPTGHPAAPTGSDAAPQPGPGPAGASAAVAPHRPGQSAARAGGPRRQREHRATAAPPRGPLHGPRAATPARPMPADPRHPSASAAVSPASALARFASTRTHRPRLGGRTWCNRSGAETLLPGTGFTTGVRRARLTLPYKVGHFFSSAGPPFVRTCGRRGTHRRSTEGSPFYVDRVGPDSF
jgi:hypothetical protein